MIPSKITKTSLFPTKVFVPRIDMDGVPPELVTCPILSPGTFPCKDCNTFELGDLFNVLISARITAPVKSVLRCVPYPTTTTSSNAFTSSIKRILTTFLFFTGTS